MGRDSLYKVALLNRSKQKNRCLCNGNIYLMGCDIYIGFGGQPVFFFLPPPPPHEPIPRPKR